MPIPRHTKLMMSTTRQSVVDNSFGFVVCRPKLVFGHLFPAKFEPIIIPSGVICPIQHWVVGQDMQAATNQQNHAKQIDEMRKDNKKWESIAIHSIIVRL
jgi:hypothetical protein